MRKILISFFIFISVSANAGVVVQGVRSLSKNGSTQLRQNVTLSPGNNVTLTQAGQDITISSTASGGSGGTETWITKSASYTVQSSDVSGGIFNIGVFPSNYSVSGSATAGMTITASAASLGASTSAMKIFCVKLLSGYPIDIFSNDLIDGSKTVTATIRNTSLCFKTEGTTFYVY